MFTKIVLFFKALKEAYNKVNSEKLEAKKHLKEVKNILNDLKKKVKYMKTAYEALSDVYLMLPLTQRLHYIQQTMDLLEYGYIYNYDDAGNLIEMDSTKLGTGYIKIFEKHIYDLENIYKNMKRHYSKSDYILVNDEYNWFTTANSTFYTKYIGKQ